MRCQSKLWNSPSKHFWVMFVIFSKIIFLLQSLNFQSISFSYQKKSIILPQFFLSDFFSVRKFVFGHFLSRDQSVDFFLHVCFLTLLEENEIKQKIGMKIVNKLIIETFSIANFKVKLWLFCNSFLITKCDFYNWFWERRRKTFYDEKIYRPRKKSFSIFY